MMTISPAFAFCILGFGSTCEKQDIINTAKNNVTATVKSGADSKSTAKVDIGETTQTVNADVIKKFLNAEEANTLFIPLTNASTKQIEFQQKTVNDLKDFAKTMVQSNQDFIKAQAAEQRKFTEELVNKVITGPPTIPVRSASSSFPIELFNNSQTTPLWVKYVDPITINNITAGSTASSTNSMINTSQQKLQIKQLADFPAGGSIGTAATTVDVASFFEINQTTSGQTVTLPTPTVVTDSSFAYIKNTGTATLTVVGTAVTSGSTILFTYSNGSWGLFGAEAATATPLTYGRVNASADLPNTGFSITSPGTKIPFNATVYSSGTTFSGTDSIIPSVAGRYRADFFAQAGSGQFNGNGTFHIVQGGVSVGSVYVDMMEAAGVNQTTPTIDVVLAAGTAVELRYQPDVADSVIWQRGSYFQLTQLPTAVAPVVDTVAEYGENASITHNGTLALTGTTVIDVPGSSFTLPSAGVWEVDYSLFTTTSVATQNYGFFIRDSSNNIVANSSSEYYSASGSSGTNLNISVGNKVFITTSGSATYKLSGIGGGGVFTVTVYNAVASNAQQSGNSKITWNKIAGQLPSTGQTVDYGSYTKTSQSFSAVGDITGWTAASGNIPTDGTNFTLTAGKTYEITGALELTAFQIAGDYMIIDLVDSSNVVIPGSTAMVFRNSSGGIFQELKGAVTAVYTPSTNTTVKLRVTTNSGTNTISTNSSLIIKQLGSTAITTNTMASVNAENSSGQSINNASNTVLTNWTEVVDAGGNFNATTGVFTAPRAADYVISSQVTMTSSAWTAGQEMAVIIRKNGATLAYASSGIQATGTFVVAQPNNITIRLAANDTIEISVLHSRGAATTLLAAGNRNYLSIRELPVAF